MPIGVRARGYAYLVRGEQVPEGDVRVELTGPDGDLWIWGPEDAAEQVTGSGYDFALLATRRRHVDDVDVRARVKRGPLADDGAGVAGLPGNDPVRLADR